MSETGVYRINKAGIKLVGHFRAASIEIEIGSPGTCGVVTLSLGKAMQLLDILKISWEDGVFLHEVLRGKCVAVKCDEDLRFVSIGDPFGNDCVEVERQ